LAKRLHDQGFEVIAVDSNADRVDAIGPNVTRAIACDARRRPVLEEIGAADVDAAVISIGADLASSVLALLALHDLKVEHIFVKVRSEEHARIADALGAEETIFPERDSASSLASRLAAGSLLRYFEIGPSLSLQEMPVPTPWAGKTLKDLALPARHGIQVVAVRDVLRDTMTLVADANRRLTPSDTLLVAGSPEALERVARLG
jgi:trk system potassium uptake protein TrkA